jgi:hypothetical protein
MSFSGEFRSRIRSRRLPGLEKAQNESAQNQTKPIPLRPSHHADYDHIFTFSNRHCMRKLSHYDRFPKQLKSQQSNWKNVNVDVIMTSP